MTTLTFEEVQRIKRGLPATAAPDGAAESKPKPKPPARKAAAKKKG